MRQHVPAVQAAPPAPDRQPEAVRRPGRQPAHAIAGVPLRHLARAGRGMGNRATIASLAEAGVPVTSPSDAVEVEAARVAHAVSHEPAHAAAPVSPATPAIGRSPRPGIAQYPLARAVDGAGGTSQPAGPGPAVTTRQPSPANSRGPPSRLPPVIAAGLAGGTPIDRSVRDRIEPTLGADLGQMRVHTGSAAAQAAASVGARAFTLGRDVVLGAGESPADLSLMAHEATHVAQQAPLALLREESDDSGTGDTDDADSSWIPDAVLEQIRSLVRAIPGYDLISAAIETDPLGGGVSGDAESITEMLLSCGPFAAGTAAVLRGLELLGAARAMIRGALQGHGVTAGRVIGDVQSVWSQLSLSLGIQGNVALVRGTIHGFLADIRAAVAEIAGALVQAVKAVAIPIVQRLLLQGPAASIWNLVTKVIGHDPLTGAPVGATTLEILTDGLLLAGKYQALAQLTETGALQEVADWVDAEIATFRGLLGLADALFADAWAAISPANLAALPEALPGLASRAAGLALGFATFPVKLIRQVLVFVRRAALYRLNQKAQGRRGFTLLSTILGRNPFTGEPVERTPQTLIGAIVRFVGGAALYEKLNQSGAIAEAATVVESILATAGLAWEEVSGTFRTIWDRFTLEDFANLVATIESALLQFSSQTFSKLLALATRAVAALMELLLRLTSVRPGIAAPVSTPVDTEEPGEEPSGIGAAIEAAIGPIGQIPAPAPPTTPARGPPATTGPRTIAYGSRGTDVEHAQDRLNAHGAEPPLAVDAIFGPLTRQATLAYQRSHGLVVDGIIGQRTWASLEGPVTIGGASGSGGGGGAGGPGSTVIMYDTGTQTFSPPAAGLKMDDIRVEVKARQDAKPPELGPTVDVKGVVPGEPEEIFVWNVLLQRASRDFWGSELDAVTAIGPAGKDGVVPQGRITLRIDGSGNASADVRGRGPTSVLNSSTFPDEAAAIAALKADFGFGSVQNGGATWKLPELNKVHGALSRLAPAERTALAGVRLVRETTITSPEGASLDGEFRHSITTTPGSDTTPSVASRDESLHLADSAFANDALGFIGDLTDAGAASYGTIVHEAGHAVETKAQRDAQFATAQAQAQVNNDTFALNKAKDATNKATTALNTAIKAGATTVNGYSKPQKQASADYVTAIQKATTAINAYARNDAVDKFPELLAVAEKAVAGRAAEAAKLDPKHPAHTDLAGLVAAQDSLLQAARDRAVAVTKLDVAKKALAERVKEQAGVTKGKRSSRLAAFVDFVTANKIPPLTAYAKVNWPDKPEEFYAEAFSLWHNDPTYLKKEAPKLNDWFDAGSHLG